MNLRELLKNEEEAERALTQAKQALKEARAPWLALLDDVRREHDYADKYLRTRASKALPPDMSSTRGRRRRPEKRPELRGFYEAYVEVLKRVRGELTMRAKAAEGVPPRRWQAYLLSTERLRLKRLYALVPDADKVKYVLRGTKNGMGRGTYAACGSARRCEKRDWKGCLVSFT